MAMRRVVFGLGFAQVLATFAIVIAVSLLLGWGWQAGLALGGIVAMSSTAMAPLHCPAAAFGSHSSKRESFEFWRLSPITKT